ncbi:hypothetical protein [Micromonospora sp. RTP1Z1]|uniref:hypothetical protein n=1 Tax=Micromonospora sp. RTP1Z1 TaxID=2994043 RepID=UPI0029C8B5C4|nr:hypothetical protein [Micromonospora sp. RTP1Z1]
MSVRFTMAMVGLTLLVLGTLALAVSAAGSAEPTTAVLLAAGAFYMAHVVASSVYSRRLRRGAGRAPTLVDLPAGGRGVRFAYSAWPYYLLLSVLVMSGLVTGLVAVAAATAGVVGVLLAVAFAALAATVGWFVVTMLRLAPGELVLSPAGIHQRGLTFTQFVPWRDVYQVSAESIHTPILIVKANMSDDTRVRRYTGRFGTLESRLVPFVAVRPYWLATNPATVYHAVAFYHSHLDLRPELGTPAAVERITDGRAVVPE